MAYDVVKTIGGREYRYRVQSERDPISGKIRNRWTYVGRVSGEGAVAKLRPVRTNARTRLLAAAEHLLEAGEAAELTVDSIARAAGVAHGTFYRYFRDRSDVLEALARHLKATRAVGDDGLLRDDVTSLADARRGVRTWMSERLRFALQRRAAVRAWSTLVASEARLAAYREERRDSTRRRLHEHLEVLTSRGFADVSDPASTAMMLMALVDGVIRATILESDSLSAAHIDAATEIADRAIFGHA